MRDWLNDMFGRGETVVRQSEVQTPLRLVLRTASGRVSVRGVEGTTATVRAQLYGEDGGRLGEMVADGIVFEEGWLRIESPPNRHGVNVNYEVMVPFATHGHLAVVNGPTEVRGIDGPVEVSLSNGPLSIEDVAGAVKVELANGPADVQDCRGAVDAKVSNGPIAIEHVTGPVNVTVSNGPIGIEDVGSSIDASATNGPISYKGAVAGSFEMRSTRGGIVLELPGDSRFELDAEADRGHVVCEFDVKDAATPATAPLPRVFLRSERGEILVRQSFPVEVS